MITGVDINTRTYKNCMSEIAKSIAKLEDFTNNLQSKVDSILKAQQTQMVNSYQNHMAKIKQQFDYLKLQLKKKDVQILQYENQGQISILLKRVQYLQAEEKKLLADLEKKKMQIKELNLQKNIQKTEMKRLQQKIKHLLMAKAQISQVRNYKNKQYESIHTSTIQKQKASSSKKLQKLRTQDRSVKFSSQKTEMTINQQQNIDIEKLKKQVSQLKRHKRQLISLNSKFIQGNKQMQNFFIETVNQIKKGIMGRKKIKQCSLEDFKKEDKLELLIKILSNDSIIFQLYSIIFGKTENPITKQQCQTDRPISLRYKIIGSNKSAEYRFPNINSSQIY